MMSVYLYNAKIVTDGKILEGCGVLVENGRISALTDLAPEGIQKVDLKGQYLVPALIDLHCHGGGGYEFIDCTQEEALSSLALHAAHGTGVLYPTLSAASYEKMYRALEMLEAIRDKAPLIIPGVHLEGPYLSPEMCGAQIPEIIRKPDPEEYESLYRRFGNLIARWDYAPEQDSDGKFLSFLTKNGIIPSTGHSAARYPEMCTALAGGNRLVTHLYSCTSTIVRENGFRVLGVIETAFLHDEIFCEVIGDGCHLPPELMKMIYQIKGADRLCLISDAIRFGGFSAEDVQNFERKNPDYPGIHYIVDSGVAMLPDKSAFGGSIATADRLIQRTVAAGIPLEDAVKMMTRTPALVMGLSRLGSIAPGMDAAFTVLDENLNAVPMEV